MYDCNQIHVCFPIKSLKSLLIKKKLFFEKKTKTFLACLRELQTFDFIYWEYKLIGRFIVIVDSTSGGQKNK